MLRRAGLLAALTALLVPAAAGTANAATRAPVVTRVAPKHVFVGETLTVYGKHFRRGVNKNSVAFKRTGAKAVFVKAEKGTTKMLKVTLPKRLEKVLVVTNGTPSPTRLKIRVLSAQFGKRYTKSSKSPIVGPARPEAPDKPIAVDPNGDCDGDGQPNKVDTDDDNDLLVDTLETQLKLDQCLVDSDGDGVEDGYEYQSARDLNVSAVPYPAQRPYPNPLFSDALVDHDGDTLRLIDEYKLWKYTIAAGGARTLDLSYSAGKQFSRSIVAGTYDKQLDFQNWALGAGYAAVSLVDLGALALDDGPGSVADQFGPRITRAITDFDRSGAVAGYEAVYFDGDGNGLDDAERDEDADGLPNQWEATGCMTRGLWKGLHTAESPYYIAEYGALDIDDEDSDGDGIRDGADDQDHDDVPNVMECSRSLAVGGPFPIDPDPTATPPGDRVWQGFVNPFNPCLPHPKSRTCNQHPQVGDDAKKWAPYAGITEYTKYYLVLN
jgi:hypothetical protein